MPLQPVTVSDGHLLLGPQTGVPQEEEEVLPPHSEVVTGVLRMAGVLRLDWCWLL